MADRTRLTAIKTQLAPIHKGAYHPAEGFESAYVLTSEGQRLSRVRLMGTIMNLFTSEDGQYGFVVIDDETETIRVKFFKDIKPIEGLQIGDIVDIIGKIRQYEGETYIQPEIVKKMEDPNFLVLRMAELLHQRRALQNVRNKVKEITKQTSDLEELKKLAVAAGINPETAVAIVQAKEENENKIDRKTMTERIVAAIEKLDDGTGVEYMAVVKEAGLTETQAEPIINELLEDGTCFEPRPGRVKKL